MKMNEVDKKIMTYNENEWSRYKDNDLLWR